MKRIRGCNRFSTQHVRASYSVLKIPLSPCAARGPASLSASVTFAVHFMSVSHRINCLMRNNVVVVANVLVAVGGKRQDAVGLHPFPCWSFVSRFGSLSFREVAGGGEW